MHANHFLGLLIIEINIIPKNGPYVKIGSNYEKKLSVMSNYLFKSYRLDWQAWEEYEPSLPVHVLTTSVI